MPHRDGGAVIILSKMRDKKGDNTPSLPPFEGSERRRKASRRKNDEIIENVESQTLSLTTDEIRQIAGDNPNTGQPVTFYAIGQITKLNKDGSAEIGITEVSREDPNAPRQPEQEDRPVRVSPQPSPS